MKTRAEVIQEILILMRQHSLAPEDLLPSLQGPTPPDTSSRGLTKVLSYLGGTLVFAGICLFIGLQWKSISDISRIILTYGIGFCLFVWGVACAQSTRLKFAATPFFLTSTALQPLGILVSLKAFSRGGDPALGMLFMNIVMLVQHGLTGFVLKRTFLILTTLLFGASAYVLGLDLLQAPHDLIIGTVGFSFLCIAWSLTRTIHRPLTGLIYFIGGLCLLSSAWDRLHNTSFEILFLGLSCAMMFFSTLARSRALLTVGTLSVLAYIIDFTAEYFKDSTAWSLVLILMGAALIGLSVVAFHLDKKYIKPS